MQIFVRSDSGRTFVLAVDRDATIQTLESLCAETQSHALTGNKKPSPLNWLTQETQDQYLSYGGVPLRSQRTLQDYDIQNNATLESRTRMRGGCFAFSITLWIIIFICFLLSLCTCGLSLPVALALIPIALVLPLCCL